MLEKTAKYVLRSLAIHLGLEETYFDQYIHNGNSILRPIHYPPIQSEPENAVRAAAHGDINLITLLINLSKHYKRLLLYWPDFPHQVQNSLLARLFPPEEQIPLERAALMHRTP